MAPLGTIPSKTPANFEFSRGSPFPAVPGANLPGDGTRKECHGVVTLQFVLQPSQRSAIAAEAVPMLQVEGKERQSTSGPGTYGGKPIRRNHRKGLRLSLSTTYKKGEFREIAAKNICFWRVECDGLRAYRVRWLGGCQQRVFWLVSLAGRIFQSPIFRLFTDNSLFSPIIQTQ